MPAAYPILLDVCDKKIVIVGGGAVGLRKALKLVEAGANDITVVSPAFVDGFPRSVAKVKAEYQPAHLAGAVLVFAATDSPAVNIEVVRQAQAQRIWVSRADEEGGDFATPAVLRDGPVVVGVWAESPALSAAIRDGLLHSWDRRWTEMALAMRTLRPLILKRGLPMDRRRKLLRYLAGEAALERLSAGGVEALTHWIMEQLDASDHP